MIAAIQTWLQSNQAYGLAAILAIGLPLVLAVAFISLGLFRSFPVGQKRAKEIQNLGRTPAPRLFSFALASLSAAATLFFAYRTIIDSNREEAETRISDQGYVLGGHEFEHAEIRCLYSWYDGSSPDWCRNQMFESEHRMWTLVMLYIEEVLWLFDASNRAQDTHNIIYAADINYWRNDVAADRTGAFSYYVVEEASENRDTAEGRRAYVGCLLHNTGLQDLRPRLCNNYRQFRRAAPAGFFANQEQAWCTTGESIPLFHGSRCDLDSAGLSAAGEP